MHTVDGVALNDPKAIKTEAATYFQEFFKPLQITESLFL